MGVYKTYNKTKVKSTKSGVSVGGKCNFEIDDLKEVVVCTVDGVSVFDLSEYQITKLIKNLKVMRDIIQDEKELKCIRYAPNICLPLSSINTPNIPSKRLFNPDGSRNTSIL